MTATWLELLTSRVVDSLELCTGLGVTERKGKIKSLVSSVAAEISELSSDADDPGWSSCLKAERLRRELLTVAQDRKDQRFSTCTKNFNEGLTLAFSHFRRTRNKDYIDRVDNRSGKDTKIDFDPSEWITKAHHTLSTITPKTKWEDISCAIALCTGRRMSEIHYAAQFEIVDKYHLKFTGQVKTTKRNLKGNGTVYSQQSFVIPTLVDSELIVNGITRLEDPKVNRRCASEKEVNTRISRYMTDAIRKNWFMIPTKQWQAVDPKDKMTYHKLRGIWFLCAMIAEQYDAGDALRYGKGLLGDRSNDAILSYLRVRIQPNSIVRI